MTKLTKGDRQRKEETAANRKKVVKKNREVLSKYLNAAVADFFLFFISSSSFKLKVCELEHFLSESIKRIFGFSYLCQSPSYFSDYSLSSTPLSAASLVTNQSLNLQRIDR